MEEFDAKLRAAAAKVQLHGTSPPNASKSANSTPENEEPEQETLAHRKKAELPFAVETGWFPYVPVGFVWAGSACV